jgi:molecular chaperone HscB
VGAQPFCPACDAPQALLPEADHFAVLGLPRALPVDRTDLERRFHDVARRVHPDRHQTASAPEQSLSVAASAAVNRAYRTLRDPVARGRYWLELHGDPIGTDNNQVPAELAELVFEVQERLADLRAGGQGAADVRAARAEVAARLDAMLADLERRYATWPDATTPPALTELKRTLSDIAYLRTLIRDADAVLAG